MKSLFSNGKFLAILAGMIAIAAVVTSIWLNPPSEIRARKLDEERLRGLRQTHDAIKVYYDAHHALPVELNVLDNELNALLQEHWHDPETQRPYEYAVLSETSYRLCAVFSRASGKSDSENNDWENNVYGYSFRKHSAGRNCFEQSVGQNGQR
jgi:hypothetical protein